MGGVRDGTQQQARKDCKERAAKVHDGTTSRPVERLRPPSRNHIGYSAHDTFALHLPCSRIEEAIEP
jgi:hypothetical protein